MSKKNVANEKSAKTLSEVEQSGPRSGLANPLEKSHKTILRRTADQIERSEIPDLKVDHLDLISKMISDCAYFILPEDYSKMTFNWITQAFSRITEYDLTEADNIGWEHLIHPDDKEKFKVHYDRLLAGRGDECTCRILTKSDKVRRIINCSRPVLDRDKVVGIFGTFQDITEHHRTLQKLKESEARFNLSFDHAGFGMAQIALNGKFIRVNKALNNVLGYDQKQFEKLSLEEISHIDDREKVLNLLVQLIKSRRPSTQTEIRCRNHTDQVLHFILSITRISDSAGEPLYFMTQFQNITTSKQLQVQLRNANERLQMEQIALKDKNIALKEVVNQIDREKKEISLRIQTNVEKLIYPLIQRLEKKGQDYECIQLLRKNLEDLTDPFVNKIEIQFRKLTPREVQICDMIRSGMTSKEIASTLNTSEETVRTQRKMIRRKLGIANNKVNLRSYLQTI